ncbi:MAG: CDP-alcohol phosphatidyltransferase family protein [Flavobacteriaceae bacterium]
MKILRAQIPNLITALNLLSGCIAVIAVLEYNLLLAAFLVVLGIIFDFFDGFAARLLHVKSELGKQLDSLADMITSGLVPGLVIYVLLNSQALPIYDVLVSDPLPLIGLLIPVGAAYRLANFNLDERQSEQFIGLPTPANALLVLSVPCMLAYPTVDGLDTFLLSPYFLTALTVFCTLIMNLPIPLFSLKFKNYGWRGNQIRYGFLVISVFWISLWHFTGLAFVILSYVLSGLIIKKE